MILAAGFGTRLRPLTDTVPKPLLAVGGAPLIVWSLLWLRRHGVIEAVINLHHLGQLIEQALGDGSQYGMRLSYSREETILGTGGGIKQAEAFFGGQPFVVVNGDTLFELDLHAMRAHHDARGAAATLAVRADPDAARWGEVVLDETGRVQSIGGRPKGPTLGSDSLFAAKKESDPKYMFAGIHILHPRLLADVPAGRESSIIDAYVRALERGERIDSFRLTGYWSDIGTPQRYAEAQRDADAGIIKLTR